MQMDDAPAKAEAYRAELLKAGVGFPGETACRLRRQFNLVSESELAALAGIDLPTLRKWRAKSEDPEHIKLGCTVLYPQAAVAEWLQRRGERLGTLWPLRSGGVTSGLDLRLVSSPRPGVRG